MNNFYGILSTDHKSRCWADDEGHQWGWKDDPETFPANMGRDGKRTHVDSRRVVGVDLRGRRRGRVRGCLVSRVTRTRESLRDDRRG